MRRSWPLLIPCLLPVSSPIVTVRFWLSTPALVPFFEWWWAVATSNLALFASEHDKQQYGPLCLIWITLKKLWDSKSPLKAVHSAIFFGQTPQMKFCLCFTTQIHVCIVGGPRECVGVCVPRDDWFFTELFVKDAMEDYVSPNDFEAWRKLDYQSNQLRGCRLF